MSHFTRIKTQIADLDHLIEALKDLDCHVETGDLTMRNLGLDRAKVQVKARLSGIFGREIGFAKSGDTYTMIGDWYGASAARQRFQEQLFQRYAYRVACAKLQAQGFDLVNETEEKGQIRLVLRRMSN